MQTSTSDQIRQTVRQAYGAIAPGSQGSCCGAPDEAAVFREGTGAVITAVKAPAVGPVPAACCNSMRLEACCLSD